jgi:hypothetical protein
MQDL